MQRVFLIHWNAQEAAERAAHLQASGFAVDHEPLAGPGLLAALAHDPPAAIVIDLSRLPSQGRDVALLLRKRKATRHVPLVFVEGDPEKVGRVHELLPDAVYTSWIRIEDSLREAIASPPTSPVVPQSQFDAYAGKPLPEKLGIRPGSKVGLVDAPPGFERTLGTLPEGAQALREPGASADLTIWFVRSRKALEQGIAGMAARAGNGPLWIAWPKATSGQSTDLTQQQVREVGLAKGLVDYKICAIDETWSGLLFAQRKQQR